MKTMPVYEYLGYTVVVNAIPDSSNEYSSVFSVHRGLRHGEGGIRQLDVVHQEGYDAGVRCATVDEAHQNAADRAREWIDKNPID